MGRPETLCEKNLKHLQKHLSVVCSKKATTYEDLVPMIYGLTPLIENRELIKLAYLTIVAERYGGLLPIRKIKELLPSIPEGLIVPAGKYNSIENLGYKKYLKNLVEKWWENLTK
jgi:hypothetical protein